MSWFNNTMAVWSIQGLSYPQKAVLANLARRAGDDGRDAWPSENRIALETSLSTKTVQRTLKVLQQLGYIKRGERRPARDPRFGVWIYDLNIVRILGEAEAGEAEILERLETARIEGADRVRQWRDQERDQRPRPPSFRAKDLDVTDSNSLATDSESLRNRPTDLAVTDSESMRNRLADPLTSHEDQHRRPPGGQSLPLPEVSGCEPVATSRETALVAKDVPELAPVSAGDDYPAARPSSDEGQVIDLPPWSLPPGLSGRRASSRS